MRLGAGALNARSTRSAGRAPTSPGTVVRAFLPRTAPTNPRSRISRATRSRPHRDAFPEQLSPDLLNPVDAEVVAVHATDVPLQLLVAHPPRCGPPAFDRIVSRGGNLQRLADRLDPESITIRVDIAGHFGSRGSSSRAKKAEAVFKISLARRSSRFSFSSSTIRCRSAVVTPGRSPWSTSAFLTPPVPQCLGADPKLQANSSHDAVALSSFLDGLENHPHRALPHLRWVLLPRPMLR